MTKIISLISLTFVLSLVLTACGSVSEKVSQKLTEKAAEKLIEKSSGGDAKVDIQDGGVKMETKDGNWQGGDNLKLPEDFPKDVYVYEGNIKAVINSNEKNIHNLSIESKDDLKKIKAKYDEELKNNGWKETGSFDTPESVMITAEKEDRITTIIAGPADGGASIITITTGQK